MTTQTLKEHLTAVRLLTGEKLHMETIVSRALYEKYSLFAGQWLTLNEFNEQASLQIKEI